MSATANPGSQKMEIEEQDVTENYEVITRNLFVASCAALHTLTRFLQHLKPSALEAN